MKPCQENHEQQQKISNQFESLLANKFPVGFYIYLSEKEIV